MKNDILAQLVAGKNQLSETLKEIHYRIGESRASLEACENTLQPALDLYGDTLDCKRQEQRLKYLKEKLATLSRRHSELIERSFNIDLKIQEIAKIMQESSLERVLKTLRSILRWSRSPRITDHARRPLLILSVFRWLVPRKLRPEIDLVIEDLLEDKCEMLEAKKSPLFVTLILWWGALRTIFDYTLAGCTSILKRFAPFAKVFFGNSK